jgi:hypothetical protein
MDRILPLASPPPPARLFFLPDAAHAWREEVDGTTARLGVQHLSLAPTCRKPRVISAVTIDDKE